MGLICLILIAVLSQWRRQVAARAATEVATTLRLQLHRQMYRLGQSSLPTEGVGPVINLWTREVNDIRDGLFADLEFTPRVHVLVGGLLVLGLLVSPTLTVYVAALGGLSWLTAWYMERDARLASDAALRDASVQLCLLHEDLGLLRTVRIYNIEEYDRKRFEEHLHRFRVADARRLVTSARLNPSTLLLFGAALALALGLLGYHVVVTKQISLATMVILFVSLTGLAYPIIEWLPALEDASPGESVLDGHSGIPGAEARVAPECGSSFPQLAQGTHRASRLSRWKADRAVSCSTRSRSRSRLVCAPP